MQFNFLLFRMLLLLCVLVGGGSIAVAQTTYRLVKVSSVETGALYVFEQDGHVMNNTISSSALQTTTSYATTWLTGKETYVWKFENAAKGYRMKNVKVNEYLTNASSNGLSFEASTTEASVWTVSFSDGVALIQNVNNSNRFLGYSTTTSYVYKAYATSNLSSYPHAITVYKLEEVVPVSITSAKYATFSSAKSVDFSTTGITVYTASVDAVNMVVRLTEVADGIVPANTGVILYSDEVKTNVEVPTTTTSTPLTDNEMVATVERTKVPWTNGDGKYNYIMQLSDGKVVFNMANDKDDEGYMPAGRAYLSTTVDASSAGAGARMLRVVFSESPSGISDIVTKRTDDATYDLLGRRVAVPAKGIYVRGGKKLFIK